MTENNKINWTEVSAFAEDTNMVLKDLELQAAHEVRFDSITQTPAGGLVAKVECETIEGNTLWLRGKFGAQNGLMSLIKAANGGENIQGSSFTITRINSDKSPSGYAYRWQTV